MSKVFLLAVAALTLVLSLFLAPTAQADGGGLRNAAIVGRVVDTSNNPVAIAEVALFVKGHMEHPVATVRTGKEGRFEFAPVREGDYVIRAHRVNVGADQQQIAATKGQVSKVQLILKKK